MSRAAGDPYLDPASGVLRNLLGITDAAELARAEVALSASRLIDLERRRLPGGYDLAHLRGFHRYILGDVYGWAGELRTVTISKGSLFCLPQHLAPAAAGRRGPAAGPEARAVHRPARGVPRRRQRPAPVPGGQRPRPAGLLLPARSSPCSATSSISRTPDHPAQAASAPPEPSPADHDSGSRTPSNWPGRQHDRAQLEPTARVCPPFADHTALAQQLSAAPSQADPGG